jgi:hypothetical protein
MSYAFRLGQTLKQAGVLGRTGELTTLLLNRLSGKARLGRELLNVGVGDRLVGMQNRQVKPLQAQLQRLKASTLPSAAANPASPQVKRMTEITDKLVRRKSQIEQAAGMARNSRMEAIGAGTLGLGAAGVAAAARPQSDQ